MKWKKIKQREKKENGRFLTFCVQIDRQILEDIHVRTVSYSGHGWCQTVGQDVLYGLGTNIHN